MGAFNILLRAVGVSFQVYIVSLIGASTSGLSALISGVFGFAVTLALSGIQLGCTRLVAQGIGTGDGTHVRHTLLCALAYALFFGSLSATLLYVLAPVIASLGLHHPEAAAPLRIMAFSLPAMAIASCLAGYFIATRRVYKSTLVQVGEQLLRILMTFFLFRCIPIQSPAHALSLLARADTAAAMTAVLCLLALFLFDRRRHANEFPNTPTAQQKPTTLPFVAKQLLAVTLPVAVSAYARSGLISLEHLLLPIGLAKFGQESGAALASYGALQSMALPVILFPTALPAAFANLLVPEVTESHVRGELPRIRRMIQCVLSLALLYAIGVFGIMLTFAKDFGTLLYQNNQASHFICLLAPLIPVMYLDSAVDAMLKGLGQQVSSMIINIIDASLSVVLVWLLVPHLGIYGYAITIYLTEIVNAALSIARLIRVSKTPLHPVRWVLKPLLSVLGACCITRLATYLPLLSTLATAQNFASLSLRILLTVLLYLVLCLLLGALHRYELRWLISLFRKQENPNENPCPSSVTSPRTGIDENKKTVYN